MWNAIALIGFLAIGVFLILGIISAVKKTGKFKRNLLFAGISLIVFIVGAVASSPVEKETLTGVATSSPAPTTSKAEIKKQEKRKAEEDAKALKEAKIHAKAEADAKEEADKAAKDKADKEAKLKAEAAEIAAEIERAPHLGESIAVGSLTVGVANKIQFTQKVGGEYLEQEAQGMYWVFSVGIKNGDKKARMIDTTMFQLVSDDGTKYEPDSMGSMYANEAGKFFLQNINPGIQTNGFIVFDMPPEAKDKVGSFKLNVDSGVGFAAGKSVEFILKKR